MLPAAHDSPFDFPIRYVSSSVPARTAVSMAREGAFVLRNVILYVHVPFCSSKCHFCSWVSPIPTTQLVKSRSHFEDYTDAVVREIESSGRSLEKADLQAKLVYLGEALRRSYLPSSWGGFSIPSSRPFGRVRNFRMSPSKSASYGDSRAPRRTARRRIHTHQLWRSIIRREPGAHAGSRS